MNEEFICGQCLKPVKGRYLFCSQACEEKFSTEQNKAVLATTRCKRCAKTTDGVHTCTPSENYMRMLNIVSKLVNCLNGDYTLRELIVEAEKLLKEIAEDNPAGE